MKKIYFTLGLGVLFLGANAQQAIKMKAPIAKSGASESLHIKGKKVKTTAAPNAVNARGINNPASTMAVIWSDDFSSAATWTMTAGAGTSANWTIGTTGGVGTYSLATIASTSAANGFATFDSDNDCSGNQIANLTTVNPINLTGHAQVRLKFQQNYRRDADSTRVYISNNGTTWTNFPVNEQYAYNGLSTNPETVVVDITSAAGNQATVWVRFTYYSPTAASSWSPNYGPDNGCGYNWMIDDVSIEDLPNNDLTALDAFSGTACGINYGLIGIDIKNSGAVAASNFPVKYKVNGGTPVVETYTATLAPGASATYYFNTPITSVANTTYSLVVYTDITGDGSPADDTAKTGFAGAPYTVPYSTSFENLPYKDLSGWSSADVDGSGRTWGLDTQVPNTGTNEMLVFENAAGTGSNWLFSPCLSIVANGIYRLKYNYEVPNLTTTTTGGALGIFMGDTALASRMTMTIVPTATVATSTAYTQGIISFTATTSGNFVLGFEASNSNAADTLVMLLDDIQLVKTGTATGISTLINNADLSMYPNPTSGLLNITTTAATATVEIYNIMGQNVLSKSITNGTSTIDIGNLSNGVYSVQIMQNNTLTVGKVIKTN